MGDLYFPSRIIGCPVRFLIALEKRPRIPALPKLPVLLALFWLAGVLCLLFLPHYPGAPKGCWMDDLTGLPCPGCGSSRAGLALLEGNLGAAFWFNPLVTTCLLGGLVITALRLIAGWQVVLRLDRVGWQMFSLGLVLTVAANWLYLLWREAA